MSEYTLKPCQDDAFGRLMPKAIDALVRKAKDAGITFKAPTGCGKTIVIAFFIREMVKQNLVGDVTFVFMSPGKGELHIQSMKKFHKVFKGLIPIVEVTDTNIPEEFEPNKVYIINWEKVTHKGGNDSAAIGEWTNKLLAAQESRNLLDCIALTQYNETKIICIIDECHIGSGDGDKDDEKQMTRAIEFRKKVLQPDLTIEVSATPRIKYQEFVEIDEEWAVEDGLIKNSVRVNPEGEIDVQLANRLERKEAVVFAAKAKQDAQAARLDEISNEIADAMGVERLGRAWNPCVIIQLENSNTANSVSVDEAIAICLKAGYRLDEIVVYVSGDENKRNLHLLDMGTAKVIITKIAVATGFDYPPASILVMYRRSKSVELTLQTVGRVMRMPELHHYGEELLDTAWVYVPSIPEAHEVTTPPIEITYVPAKEKACLPTLHGKTVIRNSSSEGDKRGMLDMNDIYPYYEEQLLIELGVDSTNWTKQQVRDALTEKLRVSPLDDMTTTTEIGHLNRSVGGDTEVYSTRATAHASKDISSMLYDDIQHTHEDYQNWKSIATQFVSERAETIAENMIYEDDTDKVVSRIQKYMHATADFWIELLIEAKKRYTVDKNRTFADRNESKDVKWNQPSSLYYNQAFEEIKDPNVRRASAFEKFMVRVDRPSTENTFEREVLAQLCREGIIQDNSLIKNPESRYGFSISFENAEGVAKKHFPDYLMKLINEWLAALEVKGGWDNGKNFNDDVNAGFKSEWLQKWETDENEKVKNSLDPFGLRFLAGVVAKHNGVWMIHRGTADTYDDPNLKSWVPLVPYIKELVQG